MPSHVFPRREFFHSSYVLPETTISMHRKLDWCHCRVRLGVVVVVEHRCRAKGFHAVAHAEVEREAGAAGLRPDIEDDAVGLYFVSLNPAAQAQRGAVDITPRGQADFGEHHAIPPEADALGAD